MAHTAKVVPGSVKFKGTSVVFQTMCCDDQSTVKTHTLGGVSRITADELELYMRRKALAAAQDHAAQCAMKCHIEGKCASGEGIEAVHDPE